MRVWTTGRGRGGFSAAGSGLLLLAVAVASPGGAAPVGGQVAAPGQAAGDAGQAPGQGAGRRAAPAPGNEAVVAVDFSSDRWAISSGEVLEYRGRDCLEGTALLDDVDMTDGTIEVDIIMDGRRSYPGVVFRVLPGGEYERFYIRPHRAGLYPDGGRVVEVLDTLPAAEDNTADFEFVAERNLLVIPTFLGNRVVAYRLADAPAAVPPASAGAARPSAAGPLIPDRGAW